MKLSKDEIIKKLAETVLDYRLVCGDESGECFVCEVKEGRHKDNCPVLLAEEVLKEKEVCPMCNGKGWDLGINMARDNRDIECLYCNGTGVKK